MRKEIHKDTHNKMKETVIEQLMEEETSKEATEKETKKVKPDAHIDPEKRLPVQIKAKIINFNAPSSLCLDTNTMKNNEEKTEFKSKTNETKNKLTKKEIRKLVETAKKDEDQETESKDTIDIHDKEPDTTPNNTLDQLKKKISMTTRKKIMKKISKNKKRC